MDETLEQITLEDFEKKYMQNVKRWDFSKFAILCKKCNSTKVEYNNTVEVGMGYYDILEEEGALVVKCHDCGNAFKIDVYDMV